jgi:hypothetical protein
MNTILVLANVMNNKTNKKEETKQKNTMNNIQKIRQNINSDFSKKDYCIISTDDLHKNCIMIEKLFDKQVSIKYGVRNNMLNYLLIDRILLDNLE